MIMKQYLGFFAAIYSITLVMIGILALFNLAIISILPLLIAVGFFCAGHFVTKEQRTPTAEEKIQLVWGSTTIAIIISSFLVFFYVLTKPNAEQLLQSAQQSGLALSALIMLLVVVIHAVVFYFSYGWYANLYFKHFKK